MRSTFVLLALLTSFSWSAAAQQTAAKVGVISIQGAIIGTKDGQKASHDLDASFIPRKKEFDTRQNELAQLQDRYSKGGSVMSEEKRNQLAREIDEKKKRLDRDIQDANEELQAEEQRVLQGLGQRILAVIAKYGKDHGYAAIFDDSSPNTPLLYASSAINITQDIVALYDETSSAVPKSSTSAPASSAKQPGTPP